MTGSLRTKVERLTLPSMLAALFVVAAKQEREPLTHFKVLSLMTIP
jgi:hypothetical protein